MRKVKETDGLRSEYTWGREGINHGSHSQPRIPQGINHHRRRCKSALLDFRPLDNILVG
jgi:hypothetical protein